MKKKAFPISFIMEFVVPFHSFCRLHAATKQIATETGHCMHALRRPSWGLRWFPAHGGRLISLGIRALKDEGYREAVDDEILTRCRLQVCREEGDREAVEKRLGFGQVEELIEESLENLNLIYEMIGPLLLWSPLSLPFCSLSEIGLVI
ncbi:hypothetical protein GW17_00008409 [Ensete ventricosum]|nr:hypothetical protein GW17_00008409 [Ensete ventricosum]